MATLIKMVARIVNPECWRTIGTSFDTNSDELFRLNSIEVAKAAIQAIADYYDNMSSEAEACDHNYIPYKNIAEAMKFELNKE